mmetsp:Transcript_29922/g.43773  ORF Transcript_29922/g.43773 Transcript_29922/m.43773 type:complete len:186 (-) Transcript_29922:122-679(-)
MGGAYFPWTSETNAPARVAFGMGRASTSMPTKYTTAPPTPLGGHSRCVTVSVKQQAKRKRAEEPPQLIDDARVAAPPLYGSGEPLQRSGNTSAAMDADIKYDTGGYMPPHTSSTRASIFSGAPNTPAKVSVKVDEDALADATLDTDLWMCGEIEGSPFSDTDHGAHGGSPFSEEEFLPFENILGA